MQFSIVIPTRNRPEMALRAIKSALRQDMPEVEVVVSDNSNAEHVATLENAVRALGDKRVTYVRPPSELAMGPHWEFALGHAHGTYVGYLTDRMAFKRDALGQIERALEEGHSGVIAYSSSGILDVAPPYRLQRPPFSGRLEARDSDWVARLFSRSIAPWGAPCMLNSFAHRDVIWGMQAVYPDLMSSSAPDLSFCMHVLDHVDKFHYLDLPLMISYGHASSNGAGFGTGRLNQSALDFASTLQRQGGLRYAPIHDLYINQNIRANEYCRMKAAQRSGRFEEMELAPYCRELAAELELQGPNAQQSDWDKLNHFMDENHIPRIKPVPWRPAFKVVTQPLLQVASDWFDFNPGNRPVGRFASIDAALEFDESQTMRPNSHESGFLRSRDRFRVAEEGLTVP